MNQTQEGLPIASVFHFTTPSLQQEKILLTDTQNTPFQQFIWSSIQKIQNEKFCTVECEDSQALPTTTSGNCEDSMTLLPWLCASASRERQSVSEHGSKWYWESPAGIFGKMKWTKKVFPATFPRGQNPLCYSTYFTPILLTYLHRHKICELYT